MRSMVACCLFLLSCVCVCVCMHAMCVRVCTCVCVCATPPPPVLYVCVWGGAHHRPYIMWAGRAFLLCGCAQVVHVAVDKPMTTDVSTAQSVLPRLSKL